MRKADSPLEKDNPFGGEVSRRQFLTGAALTGTGLVVWGGLGTQTGQDALERVGLRSSDMIEMTLRVNGGEYPLSVEPRVSLLDALRERAGLTGTKKGCNQGACGACTVHADGRRINTALTVAESVALDRDPVKALVFPTGRSRFGSEQSVRRGWGRTRMPRPGRTRWERG